MPDDYTTMLDRDGEWFIASSPQVPGANGLGKSEVEALASLKDAVALIREDRAADGMHSG